MPTSYREPVIVEAQVRLNCKNVIFFTTPQRGDFRDSRGEEIFPWVPCIQAILQKVPKGEQSRLLLLPCLETEHSAAKDKKDNDFALAYTVVSTAMEFLKQHSQIKIRFFCDQSGYASGLYSDMISTQTKLNQSKKGLEESLVGILPTIPKAILELIQTYEEGYNVTGRMDVWLSNVGSVNFLDIQAINKLGSNWTELATVGLPVGQDFTKKTLALSDAEQFRREKAIKEQEAYLGNCENRRIAKLKSAGQLKKAFVSIGRWQGVDDLLKEPYRSWKNPGFLSSITSVFSRSQSVLENATNCEVERNMQGWKNSMDENLRNKPDRDFGNPTPGVDLDDDLLDRGKPPFGNIEVVLKVGDITQEPADAIVNAAKMELTGGGGVDGAIHRAGGPKILQECLAIREQQKKEGRFVGCPTGEAVITSAGKMPAKFVIHTVGPVWHGGVNREEELLANAYMNSLKLAAKHNLKSIAFPAISTGIYGFPLERATEIALKTVKEFSKLETSVREVRFIVFGENMQVYTTHLAAIQKPKASGISISVVEDEPRAKK